jgi:cysteine desulfurase
MTYLDYSATTPVNSEVLDSFVKATNMYVGNPNSLHKLGVDSKHLIDSATKQIEELLKINDKEVIYTSGASESNNMAIKGIAFKYANRGKHIITTHLEHSSINEPLKYLSSLGYEVSYVKLDNNGLVDLEDLKRLLRNDTILVSINAVNSEVGVRQPVEAIGKILKDYPKCYFHVDATQCIGKDNIDLTDIDLVSLTAHKIYGLKGIGILLRNKKIELEPIIHGGKSTSIYRSGTPSLPLIVSISKALRLSLSNLDNNIKYVNSINKDLKDYLSNFDKVRINSNDFSVPHILNISVLGVKPESLLHALEKYDIYVSTKSACSSNNDESEAVYNITGNHEQAASSIRISLSHLTTSDDINKFKEAFKMCYEELACLR